MFAYNITNYEKWARGLKKAGYATDKNYPKKLIRVIEIYQLYRFDKIKDKKRRRRKRKIITVNKKQIPIYYQIKKGDTLYSVAKRFNTTVVKLKKINQLESNDLEIGKTLLIQ